jgi:K+-transporting ATPase c subunit
LTQSSDSDDQPSCKAFQADRVDRCRLGDPVHRRHILPPQQSARDALVIPDEKAAAAALLDEKLSGPRYFHPSSAERGTGTVSHFSGGELRISLEDVHSQVDRVVQERHFNAEQRMELQKLIERLAEPSASRIVGEPSINVLRLNCARRDPMTFRLYSER